MMKTGVLKAAIRPRRRVRAGRVALAVAVLAVGAFVSAPASAKLPLNLELPPLLPLPLPTPSSSGTLPLSQTVDAVTGLLSSVTGTVGETVNGVVGGNPVTAPAPAPKPVVIPKTPRVGSWSIDRLPALQGPGAATQVAKTTVGSTQLDRPGSYTSLVGGGLRAAAGRAARLAGPLAAPLAVALFALVMLAVASRGPGRLVKVEEERQFVHERRTFRL